MENSGVLFVVSLNKLLKGQSNCQSYGALEFEMERIANTWNGPTSKWLRRCTSTEQESSIEFEMEQIRPAVVELRHRQGFIRWACSDGPMSKWGISCTFTYEGVSYELKMERIDPAVLEWQHPQEFGCLTGILGRAWWANDHTVAHLRSTTVP